MTSTGTDLAAALQGALALARGGKPLDEVMSAALAGTLPPPPAAPQAPAVPSRVVLTEEAQEVMQQLPALWGWVRPEIVRELSTDELEALGKEDEAIRLVLKVLEARKEAISQAVKNHQDKVAERLGTAVPGVTPADKDRHYILATPGSPERIPRTGGTEWSREYRETLRYSDAELADMRALGEITRAEHEAMTSRQFDPGKAHAFLGRNPSRALAILRRIATVSPGTSLYVRDAK
jgi:hypothetical protein